MRKFLSWKIAAVLIVTLGLAFFDLPSETQQKILPFTPQSITDNKIYLGLDLQGGSQLDYKIDLRKVPEADQEDIIDGVLEVIERRVNSLGVSEPNIYTSELGGEYHIIVELAQNATISQDDVDNYLGKDKTVAELTDDEMKTVSLEKAKATVGKTIQLEFKEEKAEPDPEEEEKVRADAKAALDRVKAGESFEVVGQEEQQAFPGKVVYNTSEYLFAEDIPEKLRDTVTALSVGSYSNSLIESGGSVIINQQGQVEQQGVSLVKLADKSDAVKTEKEVEVSHILVAYQGADRADAAITRTEDEAETLADEILTKLKNGEDFGALAQEYSDDKGSKEQGGRLDTPVTGDGTYVFDFEEAALGLESAGDLSQVTKTQFGFHIIRANEVKADLQEPQYKYETITYSLVPDLWDETGLTGEHFVHADVQLDQFYQPYVQIQFNDEGADLFEQITERNVGKRLAIFVGGELISAPTVNSAISGGTAQITGQFTSEEAENLARDLNTGAIPAPIVLTSENTIGATLGQQALADSVEAGIIGLLLIAIFMVILYRVPGVIAVVSLGIYAAIFLFLIKSQLSVGLSLGLSTLTFGYLIARIVANKDSGWEKFLSFILACIAFFFLTFILKTAVVLTLAGVAGIILSIGMAVDANILIFERFKEELREGKTYTAALETGFERAWSAIRDSNFSTLLICLILFTFGSSIIKGFAFTLAAGVLVSMFTAITITRLFLLGLPNTKIVDNQKLLGLRDSKPFNFQFMRSSKIWLSISGALVAISVFAAIAFGLNLGIDFTGGTLMEFKFNAEVTKQELADKLGTIEDQLNTPQTEEGQSIVLAPESSDQDTISEAADTIDLRTAQILPGEDGSFIVKTKYLSSDQHDMVLEKLKEIYPEIQEPRFTTIGPTIGSSLLASAVKAILIALAIIIIYVAFAFRKVPKEVSPWRFGACAIAALIHDVVIVTGLFVLLGQFLGVEIDALFVTAMLTVFGYSVNDTIIIFDRIREHLIRDDSENLSQIADKALNETFTRSLNTSLSTLIALLSVLFLGSGSIFYFILALTTGVVVGTYSSLLVASPLLVFWHKRKTKSE